MVRDLGISLTLLLVIFITKAPVRADEPVPPGESSDLVRKLGDGDFRVREQAEAELIRRGAAAIVEVKRGAQDDDLEIRRRSQAILSEIQRSPVDRFLAPFVAGKDDPKVELPGWAAVRGVMGMDETSRYLYALLYKNDRPLLEALEKSPKTAAAQFDSRLQKLMPQFKFAVRPQGPPAPRDIPLEEITGILLIATAESAGLDAIASNKLFNILNQPNVQQSIGWSNATRRLTEKWIERKCDDPNLGPQAFQLATVFGCTDLLVTKLRPATVKLVEAAAANPGDFNLFYRALNQARQVHMPELVEQKLKPAITKSLVAATKEPIDFNKINQFAGIAQSLGGMEAELKPILRPALEQLVKKQAAQMKDFTSVYALVNLARLCQSQDLIDDVLRPAYRTTLLRVAAEAKDLATLNQAFYQAQALGMQADIESILKPAAIVLIQKAATRTDDNNRLQQAMGVAQTFQIKEALRPLAQQLLDDVARSTPDVNRIFVVIQLVRAADLPNADKIIDNSLKPAARKSLLAAADLPLNPATISQSLHLAEQLQLKEGVALALKAAQAKAVPSYARSQAIFHIAKFGGKDNIPQLEALLGDTADLGTNTINGTTIRTQIGDVALASVIHLSGQKVADYDFTWMRLFGQMNNQVFQPSPNCYGFDTDAARAGALKKYRDSRDNPKS